MIRGLRGRLTAAVGLAVVAGVLVTVAIAALLLRDRVADTALRALGDRAETAATVLADGGTFGRRTAGSSGAVAGGGTQTLVARGGRVRPAPARLAGLLPAVDAAGNDTGRIDADGRPLLFAVADVPGGGRLVLFRRAQLAADWRPHVVSLAIAGIFGALLAGGLGVLIARRMARPVRRLSAATAAVAAGDPGAAVPVEGPAEVAELSAAFNAMAVDLTDARRREREFLQSVSHELKTPLTAVRGYAEALTDGAVDPEEAGAVIGAESARLERLVGDLLELGRLQRPGFAVHAEPVDLLAVAEAAAERFGPRAAVAGVGLRVAAGDVAAPDGDVVADGDLAAAGGNAPGGGAFALADAERVLQAVANLVDNALRVTPAGGIVTISAASGRVAVADTGPGLAPEDAARAFERFHLHDRSMDAGGSGLGLALVAELAAAMGGRAEVESTPGAGTTFALSLPARSPAAPRTPAA